MNEAEPSKQVERFSLREYVRKATLLTVISGLAVAGVMRVETALAEHRLPAEEAQELAETVSDTELKLERIIRWFANSRGCGGGAAVGYIFTPVAESENLNVLVCNGVSTPTSVRQLPSR